MLPVQCDFIFFYYWGSENYTHDIDMEVCASLLQSQAQEPCPAKQMSGVMGSVSWPSVKGRMTFQALVSCGSGLALCSALSLIARISMGGLRALAVRGADALSRSVLLKPRVQDPYMGSRVGASRTVSDATPITSLALGLCLSLSWGPSLPPRWSHR